MTIQLQLKPEIEARLIAEASAQGLSLEAYLTSLIEDSLTNHRGAEDTEQGESDAFGGLRLRLVEYIFSC